MGQSHPFPFFLPEKSHSSSPNPSKTTDAGALYSRPNLCFDSPLMPKDERPPEKDRDREPIWSVAKGWLPWYLLLTFTLLFVWSVFTVWVENDHGNYPARGLLIQAIVIAISGGVIGIVIFCLAVVTAADTGGGFLVVTYRYLNNKFVEPLRRQLRQEGREQGIEQGIEQGREEGIEEGIERGREEGRQEGIERGRQEGIERGREEGRQEGIEQGRQEGRQEGIERGREEGRQEGIEQGRREGMAQGREQIQEFKMRTMEWYARQQQALAKGESFDEPPPFIGSANGKDPAGE